MTKKWMGVAICIALVATRGLAAPPKVQSVERIPKRAIDARESKETVPYDIVELAVTLDKTYPNPFDPDTVRVDAIVTEPGGITRTVPAFWGQTFERFTDGKQISLRPVGAPGWRVRLCPPKKGVYRVLVQVTDSDGLEKSKTPLLVTVAAGTTPMSGGFVRRVPRNNQVFQLDNGDPFLFIGENMCWGSGTGLADFDQWMPDLAHAGGNYIRLWMAHDPIETKATGLNHYDLYNAAHLDEILATAERNGLRCMVAFGTYGEFTVGGFFNEGQWLQNPYNVANGGTVPGDKPDDFFINPDARKTYRKRLRYIIARYGAFPGVAFWEFWNEKDGDSTWFAEMAQYVRANDPYKHLITNSSGSTGPAAIWQIPEFDLTQTHRYGDNGSIADIAPGIPDDARAHTRFNKPHLMGEFGIAYQRGDENYDKTGTGTNLHNGLWASTFSGNAGGAAIWWWDGYVAPKHLYPVFTGLAKFAKTVNWKHNFAPLTVPVPSTDPNIPETFTDLVLNSSVGWGEKAKVPMVLQTDGTVTGSPLLNFLYGTAKPELSTKQVIQLNAKTAGFCRVHITKVSDRSVLRMSLDGKMVGEFPLFAEPGHGNQYVTTTLVPEYKIYQADFDKTVEVPIPAGKHTLTLENTDGDWLQMDTLTLTNYRSSRYADLRPYALTDPATGEILLWLQDPASNWKNDAGGKTPQVLQNIRLAMPVTKAGNYAVEWWDTRKGEMISRATVRAQGGLIRLIVPMFTRDIALKASPK